MVEMEDFSPETDEQPQLPPIRRRKARKINQAKFAPCMKVILADKSTVQVPVDKASSDAQRSILVAKARDFVEAQLARLKAATLTPAEVKDLVKAVSDVDSLQREQYVAGLNRENDRTNSALGRNLQAIVQGAAEGAVKGATGGFLDKMKQMDAAAKRVEAEKKVIQLPA